MYVAVFSLCILLSGSLCGLILPMTKPDGSTDLSSLLSHVTLLEQTVTGLQTTTVQLQSDLQSNKAQAAAEISSLTNEVASLKTELRVSSNDLAVLKAEVNDMRRGNSNANTQVNLTVLDSISHEVKLNTAQVSAVQSDVKMLHKQLSLVNSTVYDVKREADSFIKNTSSVVQLLTHKQVVENMEIQSTNAKVERLELDTNKTSADLHITQKNLNLTSTEVTTFRNDLSVVQKQSLDNKHSLTQVSQDVQLVSADVHTTKNNISLTVSEVATLKADLTVVQKQSLVNKQLVTTLASKNRNVAFQAQNPPFLASSNTSLTFRNVDYNAGSGYNNNTGKFTAPVSGTYMFWTQLEMYHSNSGVYVNIMKSGVRLAAGYVRTDSAVLDADASAVTVNHLNKGEEVWVVITFSNRIFRGYGASYFGGVMVSAD